ncbi:unnamed protein product, partial [Medioppia subpectinata]
MIIGAINCNFEEQELKVDKMIPKYERLGNGVECPEKVELILAKCKEMAQLMIRMGNCEMWDILDGFKYAGYLKPILRDVILESTSLSSYEKIKIVRILRSQLEGGGGKGVRDVRSIVRKYWDDVLNMHEDIDGFRESTRERIAIFPSFVTRAEEHLGVKADAKCELGEKYPDAKHKSITVSLIYVIPVIG